MMGEHKWTTEQKDALRILYRQHSAPTCCELLNARFGLNLSASQVTSAASRHKMRSGRTGRFEKGEAPWNKGKPHPSAGRSVQTQFKRGQRPHTWRPVGTETKRSDGYTWVKIAENTWREKHRIIYEQAHGPIPKGYAVIFLDQNRSNMDIGNLRLLHRKYLCIANKSRLLSPSAELTETGLMVAKVKAMVGEARRRVIAGRQNERTDY